MPSVRKAKKDEDVGGQGAKEETNWNHLPNELKHMCVKEMTIETRWKLRQASHSDRLLVDSVRLYADEISFHNNYLSLHRDNTGLQINFKYNRSKYIPFLAYLLSVLELKELDPDLLKYVSFWNVLHRKLPHGEGTLKAKDVISMGNCISGAPTFTKSQLRHIKVRRRIRDVYHQVFGGYSEAWNNLHSIVQDWQWGPPEVGHELIIHDSEMTTKKLKQFVKTHIGKFFIKDGYEQAFIGTNNLERIMYLYREVGSNWYHIVMRAVEPDDFVNTERWKEMKTFNYKPKID